MIHENFVTKSFLELGQSNIASVILLLPQSGVLTPPDLSHFSYRLDLITENITGYSHKGAAIAVVPCAVFDQLSGQQTPYIHTYLPMHIA